jgi:hypothetical protein
MMTPEQAIQQVNNTIFRPGWKLSAMRWGPSSIYVDATIDTVDTSTVSPSGNYYEPRRIAAEGIVRVENLDQAGLCHAIMEQVVRPSDEHEDREFMRVRQPDGTWFAPLHPHRPDGQRAWDVAQLLSVAR